MTALIASTYDNLMNYLQALFSIFNAPLFATFIIGMFWKRMTPAAGFWGLIAGTLTAAILFIGHKTDWIDFGTDLNQSMWGAGAGLRGRRDRDRGRDARHASPSRSRICRASSTAWPTSTRASRDTTHWWESPKMLGGAVLAGAAVLTIVFW